MFSEPRAYENYSKAVRELDRYALSAAVRDFLDEFRSQLASRERKVPRGFSFFRAANDCEEHEDKETGHLRFSACGDSRMLPKREFAVEGRANPQGVVVLYVATSSKTAISEIRPWVGDWVSVVNIKTTKEMTVVDLSASDGQYSALMWREFSAMLKEASLTPEQTNQIVWAKIDNAFSRPVGRTTSRAEYVPTQILASVIRDAGYDGLAYKSAFGGEGGYNVALFSTEKVWIRSGHLHEIKKIEFTSVEVDNPWFRADPPKEPE